MSTLDCIHDTQRGSVSIAFPENLKSSNVDQLRGEAEKFLTTRVTGDSSLSAMHMDLSRTTLVDSLGLNLLFALIQFAKKRGSKVTVLVKHTSVRLLFRTVRLDQHVEVLS